MLMHRRGFQGGVVRGENVVNHTSLWCGTLVRADSCVLSFSSDTSSKLDAVHYFPFVTVHVCVSWFMGLSVLVMMSQSQNSPLELQHCLQLFDVL